MQMFSDQMRRDPFPVYASLRRQSPLISDPQGAVWMLFDYETIKRVLMEHEHFSSAVTPPDAQALDWIVFTDPPQHTLYRNIVTRAFTPRSISGYETRIRAISRELLDRRRRYGDMDLINDYAAPYPGRVIASILGLPAADVDAFLAWNDILQDLSLGNMSQPMGPTEMRRHAYVQQKIQDYLSQQILLRRQRPTDDLLTRLVEADVDGERLSVRAIMGFAQLLFSAATETTTNLIGNAVLCFVEHPEQLARLKANPELLPMAVEEVLRFRSPIQSLIRKTRQQVVLHGQTIPAGRMIFNVLGSANRDPAQFSDPDRFDIGRDPNPHMAFGYGAHYCLGTQLGRLEAKIALEDLFWHLEDLSLLSPDWKPHKAHHLLGPARLRVKFKV